MTDLVRRMLMITVTAVVAGCGGGGTPAGTAPTPSVVAASAPATPAGPVVSDGTVYGELRTAGAKLMLHQRGTLAITPASFASRLTSMDTTLASYNGTFLKLPVTSALITKNAPVSLATITADLAPMASVRPAHLKLNFALVEWKRDLDPFDDWSVVIANFANLAKAANAAGLVGLVIDNEASALTDDGTTGLRVNYPADVRYASIHTLPEYRDRTQLISKQIMQAMLAEFPRLALVVLRGPAASEFATPSNLTTQLGSEKPALLGSFFTGFVEAKTAAAWVVDGGNDYNLRTADAFAKSAAWRKTGLATGFSSFIPSPMLATWPMAVSTSFGVRENDGYFGQTGPSVIPVWESSVTSALRNAEAFAWTSFDSTDMASAAATNAFVQAAARAKAGALSPASKLSTMAPGSGTGLLAEYFDTDVFTNLLQSRIDPSIDYFWSGAPDGTAIMHGEFYAVIWSGYLEAPTSGNYAFSTYTDDGVRLTVNGITVIDSPVAGAFDSSTLVPLTAGQRYPIKVEWSNQRGAAGAHVSWLPPGGVKAIIPTARLYPAN